MVETASCRNLSSSSQNAISEDQKHSSVDARVHYPKQRSREVASKAHEFFERLHGDKGSEIEMDVFTRAKRSQKYRQGSLLGYQD